LGRAAAEVATDAGRAAELRRRGLEQAGRFTWGQTAKATIAAYDSVLSE
jgi:hypothetical protein